MDLTPEMLGLIAAEASRRPTHEHCWHPWSGPIHMVLQNGHVLMKCCKCESTETRHGDHVRGHAS